MYLDFYSETGRFQAVWEALKNNMSKLRAMRIKRRESGYWGLISVRFSRTGSSRTVFEWKKKEKRRRTRSIYEFIVGTNDESRVEIARLLSVILLSILFRTVIKIDERLCLESRLERWVIRNRDKIGWCETKGSWFRISYAFIAILVLCVWS